MILVNLNVILDVNEMGNIGLWPHWALRCDTKLHLYNTRAAVVVFCQLVAAGMGCGEQLANVDEPTPPDMSALVEMYEAPDGTFATSSAEVVLKAAQAVRAALESIAIHTQVIDALESVFGGKSETDDASGEKDQPSISEVVQGTGYLVVTRICSGWATKPIPAAGNGKLTIYVNFSDQGLNPVIWGAVDQCHYRVGDAVVSLSDGASAVGSSLRLYVGNSMTFKEFGGSPMLFAVDLNVTINDEVLETRFNVRIDPQTGQLATAIPVDDGVLIVSMLGTEWRVQAANGIFECDPKAWVCEQQ